MGFPNLRDASHTEADQLITEELTNLIIDCIDTGTQSTRWVDSQIIGVLQLGNNEVIFAVFQRLSNHWEIRITDGPFATGKGPPRINMATRNHHPSIVVEVGLYFKVYDVDAFRALVVAFREHYKVNLLNKDGLLEKLVRNSLFISAEERTLKMM